MRERGEWRERGRRREQKCVRSDREEENEYDEKEQGRPALRVSCVENQVNSLPYKQIIILTSFKILSVDIETNERLNF